MKQYKFDVIIIGAGPAGVTAAGALAGTGISVALLEAGVYAGAENWSGCVYFTECLAEKDCFGNEAVLKAPFERRVVRRGTLMHNGLDVVGVELTSPDAFKNCYTVLRPIYDPYFTDLARRKGAVHLTETTVTSLIRKDKRVGGVQTNRGPLYADLTFIAEGDASHLVRAEQLERAAEPHFLQGVKAVLSLGPDEIERRFRLSPGEGAAYELLLRNPSIGGRTAQLNVGGFLYTNQDSLSVGYVVPLDNVRNNFRGNHDNLFEWMKGLPYIKELTEGAGLSAYGTKIIRSGGWRERPKLVEDGLVVGGAAAGLGVDLPFPNFTGPASATGLHFARAARALLLAGRTPDEKNLAKEYLAPLRESVYGKNARYLSQWPHYFGRTKVLFSRTVDMACGTAHFLSEGSLVETGRFLRSHLLSFRGLKESITDTMRAISSLRLWKQTVISAINPSTFSHWVKNLKRRAPAGDPGLGIILHIAGKDVDATTLPWPVGPLIKRLSPALVLALEQIYANDDQPVGKKFSAALRHVMRGLNLIDLAVLPLFGLYLFFIALSTALWDAFRFYVLKTPVDRLLAEPVMAYGESQRKARDLDAIRPAVSLEAKLATNTYCVGTESHIRTLWPESIKAQPDMSQAGLWWVCPARVYVYDAPPFVGRGRVTVNYENCIKCESCWRAEPGRVLWGRHTEHRLIYRPESAALTALIGTGKAAPLKQRPAAKAPVLVEETMWYVSDGIKRSSRAVLTALTAFSDSVTKLPASADKTRQAWPAALGMKLGEKLGKLEAAFVNDGRPTQAQMVRAERNDLEARLVEGRLFHALYCGHRVEQRLRAWTGEHFGAQSSDTARANTGNALTYDEVSGLFPDRIVKQWEEEPLPAEWAGKLWAFIAEHRDAPQDAVRALSSVSPALGLVAAHQFPAAAVLSKAGITLPAGICAVPSDGIDLHESIDSVTLRGTFSLLPLAACNTLLVISNNQGHLVPLSTPGVTITPTPAIGFRAAGLSDVVLDCTVKKQAIMVAEKQEAPDAASYLAIALGAGDYLCKRITEHAAGRVQFPGQMLDTEGRDGIAKLGAVKALIARTEAWRLLLLSLYDADSALRTPNSELDFDLLRASVAAMAFSPEPGAMGYDAGQVFGGFAYSEDDLLSRYYRDSSLFRYLAPGYGAPAKLQAALGKEELDQFLFTSSLDATLGEPLGPLASRLTAIAGTCALISSRADTSLAGKAKAIVLAVRYLLAAIEQGLDEGKSMEAEAYAVEVLLGLAEDAVQKAEMSAGRGTVSPTAVFPVEPAGDHVTLEAYYEAFCRPSGAPHRSGRFLTTAFDRSARFVPEMQLHDVKLRARWTELADWFKKNCRDKKFDGLHIERYIERIHRLPDEVLQAVKDNKWLATTIPENEDGLGWRKAEYYILNAMAGSFGDAGIDLLIMANTSIGTTPILLGLEEELPRVREELAPLAQNERSLGEIRVRLSKLVQALSNPNPAWIRKEYEAVMKLVDERIRRTRVVKYLAANFLRAFYGAGIAGRRGDFNGFMSSLKHASELFSKLMPDVRAALEELPRRERCHRLFLRTLGHGGVSAFALTEPTAGSDSGGVKTTARLMSAKLTSLDDGRYSFYLNNGDEKNLRYLIDADRIVFIERGIAYRTPDGRTAAIQHDRYDYATDEGVRTFVHNGKECPFHDIGQVRESHAGPVYEYYSMTGAKMWITNGSIATQFCVYAQTTEGVTGFMVDRHAEGLKVGADEKKTGQRGSPTNEISIDSARIPREAVIGYEGHGQVNALETLNVGRCGLAVVSGALMRKLMQEAAQAIPASPERDSLLGEAAAVLFGSETLAYYLVGLFDRPHESVRMESAIAKYACSEDIHELLTLVERAFGPVGQTEKFLLEKARRDSRILTIYEGTNEVQRFLILKDLIAQAADWPEIPEQHGDVILQALASWKRKLRLRVKEAAAFLGDASWSDAMLQPALFPLAEMAGEILRFECIYYRMGWLNDSNMLLAQNAPEYIPTMQAAAQRAADRALARLEHLDEKYASAWARVRGGLNMPEVAAADAALDRMERQQSTGHRAIPGALAAPVSVLCIIRPVAELSPRPRVQDGDIRELVWRIDPSDMAGLAQALDLKAKSGPQVTVDVLMAGGTEHEDLLRLAAGVRADGLVRLDTDPSSGAGVYGKAVRDREVLRGYDLIIVGAECRNGDQGLGAFLAGSRKKHHYRRERFEVKPDGTGLQHLALPAVISVTGKPSASPMGMTDAVASMHARIRETKPGKSTASRDRFALPAGTAVTAKTIMNTLEAAEYLKAFAASASAGAAPQYKEDVIVGNLTSDDAVWAVLDPNEPKSNLAVLRASGRAADLLDRKVRAAVAAPRELWPQLLGLARANGCEQAYCIDTRDGRLSNDGKRNLLRSLTKTSDAAFVLAGTGWAGSFAFVAGELEASNKETLLCSGVTRIKKQAAGRLVFSLPVYEGRLVRLCAYEKGPAFVTVALESDFPARSEQADFTASALAIEIDPDWILPLPPVAAPTLSQADVIIDLGYGIRDNSGYELAQELKKKLEAMGLAPMFGATRKVTQDLKLLPLDAQIGQTGVRVNPRLIIALGISGAPQHVDYLGTRAEILCFNKDTEAPLMKFNQTLPFPRVHPIAGDLFVTVRELIERLGS
jgi:alkylation response protein AidB-like acyl-CoA dehydrogenase/flavin-dependent dehydrogenase/electron transfer flavoprotein alpha subunit/ferredoxin-like protein FixX